MIGLGCITLFSAVPVTVQDAQALRYCVRGMRRGWVAMGGVINGVTFEQFIHQGVTVGWLVETGHPYALTLAEHIVGGLGVE